MADFTFGDLKKTYENFLEPKISLNIGGEKLGADSGLGVVGADIEQTSGFEASIATVQLSGSFNNDLRSFDISKTKKFLYMGSTIIIYMGYALSMREVFRGFIARVHFIIPDGNTNDVPSIELTCMDVKGLMMAGRHSKRLKAKYYSDAVKEVLSTNPYIMQKDGSGKDFVKLNISNTPDKPAQAADGGAGSGADPATTDKRVEMVEESDYDFVVKAAKKYNFDFFMIGDTLYFIEAKKNTTPLIELSPGMGLNSIDVGYDITGLTKTVEVRNIDMDQGKYIGSRKKSNSRISMGNVAKSLIEKQTLVYLDPTTDSKTDAGYRADYLLESINYRLGSIEASFVGIPELTAGRFIKTKGFGQPLDNSFYLTTVRHILDDGFYTTRFEGCASSIEK